MSWAGDGWRKVRDNASDAWILGTGADEGDWKLTIDGNNLAFQRLESGVWVNKGGATP